MGATARPERAGGILVAAGSSSRMGFDKVWALLDGRPVLSYSMQTFASSGLERVVLVVGGERLADARALAGPLGGLVRVCVGGARRRDSVAAGLAALEACEWVVVHDAARPLISVGMVHRGLEAARESGAAVPGLPLADTVKRVRSGAVVETLPRDELRRIQTPQVFRRELLERALHSGQEDVGDEATLLERLGHSVHVFEGEERNFKLTHPGDLELAEALLRLQPGVGPGQRVGVSNRLSCNQ